MPFCTTCPHACQLEPGQLGRCRARRATDDAVVPEAYGRVTSVALDPIEKKPIARFRPNTMVLSLGGYGCNMRCAFCQNYSIAHAGADDVSWREVTPEEVVRTAVDLADRRCIGIAYTYNEPLITWEFVRDTAMLAHEAGLMNVIVSNGMASGHVVAELAPLIDAANIDLKCFTAEGYQTLGGDFGTVRATIETLANTSTCHVEVTTLVVPGLSDGEADIDAASSWLASLDADITYHLTRFFPRHRMADAEPTPIATLRRLADIASAHLEHVIIGNV